MTGGWEPICYTSDSFSHCQKGFESEQARRVVQQSAGGVFFC